MKQLIFFITIVWLLNFYVLGSMQTSQEPIKPQPSILSLWTHVTPEIVGTFLVDVLTFDPKQPSTKKYFISENLIIVAPPDIKIKKTKRHLIVAGHYYDSTLRGKFIWKNGALESKKGTQIAPLV